MREISENEFYSHNLEFCFGTELSGYYYDDGFVYKKTTIPNTKSTSYSVLEDLNEFYLYWYNYNLYCQASDEEKNNFITAYSEMEERFSLDCKDKYIKLLNKVKLDEIYLKKLASSFETVNYETLDDIIERKNEIKKIIEYYNTLLLAQNINNEINSTICYPNFISSEDINVIKAYLIYFEDLISLFDMIIISGNEPGYFDSLLLDDESDTNDMQHRKTLN